MGGSGGIFTKKQRDPGPPVKEGSVHGCLSARTHSSPKHKSLLSLRKAGSVHGLSQTSTTQQPKTEMAASSFALACDALARERDRAFLVRVSADYNIPLEELESKYLVEAEAAIKIPKKKGPRKAKVTVEGQPEAPKCQAMTAKKGQCSFSALKGECFCKRHLKQQNEPKQDVPKAVKPEPKKAAAKVEPVHSHPVDEDKHEDCSLCQTHGNVLELEPEEEFEEVSESDDEPPARTAESDAEPESDFDDE